MIMIWRLSVTFKVTSNTSYIFISRETEPATGQGVTIGENIQFVTSP